MKPMAIALVMVVSVAVGGAHAQTPPMVSIGAASHSCGEWVSLADKGESKTTIEVVKLSMLESWVQGFVVGSAIQLTTLLSGSPDQSLAALQAKWKTVSGWVYDPPDANATEYWITNYCRSNPLDPVLTAANGLVAEVFTKK